VVKKYGKNREIFVIRKAENFSAAKSAKHCGGTNIFPGPTILCGQAEMINTGKRF